MSRRQELIAYVIATLVLALIFVALWWSISGKPPEVITNEVTHEVTVEKTVPGPERTVEVTTREDCDTQGDKTLPDTGGGE